MMHYDAHFSMKVQFRDQYFLLEAKERTAACGEIIASAYPLSGNEVDKDNLLFSYSFGCWVEAVKYLKEVDTAIILMAIDKGVAQVNPLTLDQKLEQLHQ